MRIYGTKQGWKFKSPCEAISNQKNDKNSHNAHQQSVWQI